MVRGEFVVKYDLTDRKSLVASLPKGGVVAEIGVDVGTFSAIILEQCEPKKLVLVDAWREQSKEVYGDDPANNVQRILDGNHKYVVERFSGQPVEVIRGWSVDVSQQFPDGYFDWVFIDANHLQARQDAEAWWPKIHSGGWLLGHDYTMAGDFITVKRDIDAWVKDNGLTLQVAGLESDDVYERNYPSWIVEKP